MEEHKPKSLKELIALRTPIRNANFELRKKLSRLDKSAIWITNNVGTMGFFYS
jgi:hypothetical protein